jgi:hypothetical protein
MTKWLDPMNTAVALRDKLAEGDLDWIRARFADGDLNFLRDRLAAGDRAVFARHLATGDLPWIRTVLSNVTIPDVGPLAGPGSVPSSPIIAATAPTEQLNAQPTFSHSASGISEYSAQRSPGVPHLPPPPVGSTPIPIGSESAAQWAATAAVAPVAAPRVDLPPVPVNIARPDAAPQPVVQPTSQITQTTTNFEVSDGAQQTLDLGRPRRRWPWLLLVPALLIGGVAFAKSRSKSETATPTTIASVTTKATAVSTTIAPATTKAVAPVTTVAPATVAPATTKAAPAVTTVAPATTKAATATTVAPAVTTAPPAATTVAAAPTTKAPAPAPTTAVPAPATVAPPAPTPATTAAPAAAVLASIVFNDSSVDLTGEAYAALAKLAGDLKAKGVPATLVITAYSDGQPSRVPNTLYMDERNENVVKELQRLGINTNYKRVRGGVATRRVDVSAGA